MIWKTVQFQKKLVGRVSQVALRHISTNNALRKTFYESLGLERNATQADIKKAYFELSKIYHPDRIEATDENLARFREISAAYEILSNEQSRKLYDRGLLGEADKPIPGEVPEVIDPIVQFYKQRQELSKSFLKPAEEVKTWTPPPRKYKKSPILQKYNYFKKQHELTYNIEKPFKFAYPMAVVALFLFYMGCNLDETNLRVWWLNKSRYD